MRRLTAAPLLSLLIAAPVVAGCSAPMLEAMAVSQPPADYVKTTATFVTGLSNKDDFRGALISPLVKSEISQPNDWFACVKLTDQTYYAFFYIGSQVSDYRRPVGVDRCPEPNQPLVTPAPPAASKPRRR